MNTLRACPRPRGRSVESGAGGERKLAALREVGIETVLDLRHHYPRRWVDRTNEAGSATSRSARRRWCSSPCAASPSGSRRTARRSSRPWWATAAAGSTSPSSTSRGARSSCAEGLQVALFGKPEVFRGGLQMTNPIVDLIGDRTGRIVPIYPQSEKAALTTWEIAGWWRTRSSVARPVASPTRCRRGSQRRLGLIDRTDALRHPPARDDGGEGARLVAARVRRAAARADSAGDAQAGARARVAGHPPPARRRAGRPLRAALPYELTGAQQRVIAEIEADLAGPHPMHRLLQGDVGAGKTWSPSARCSPRCRAGTRAR
jgi:ATP-dependent DNA helicase RecG